MKQIFLLCALSSTGHQYGMICKENVTYENDDYWYIEGSRIYPKDGRLYNGFYVFSNESDAKSKQNELFTSNEYKKQLDEYLSWRLPSLMELKQEIFSLKNEFDYSDNDTIRNAIKSIANELNEIK